MPSMDMQPVGRRMPNASTRSGSTSLDVQPDVEEPQQYLTFMLGDEMFAIAILSIREIIEYVFVSSVPMTPPFIRGVLNLRGAVVPVVDLAVRFGRQAHTNSKRTCIVIVDIEAGNGGQQQMGLIVDAVNEVLEIADGDIKPPPEFGTRIRNDFVRNMGEIEGKFVVILDLNHVLSVSELAVAADTGSSPMAISA